MQFGFIVLIIVSLAPILILLWYFDRLDRTNPESKRILWSIFMWGVMVTFVAGVAEYFLDTYLLDLFYLPIIKLFVVAFLFTAVVEEALKYWVVKKKAYVHPAFNEYFDGIIYSVVASLGFAALENIFYVFENGIFIGITRALMAVPAHALFGCMMGYYIGLAKFETDKEKQKKLFAKGLFLAVFFHGLYDFLLLSASAFALLAIPLLLAMAINVKYKIAHLHVLDKIKGAALPAKWTIGRYIKAAIGLVFFTIGVLTLFTMLLYYTNDPIGAKLFADIEFELGGSLIFMAIAWGITYLLLREKRTKKVKA